MWSLASDTLAGAGEASAASSGSAQLVGEGAGLEPRPARPAPAPAPSPAPHPLQLAATHGRVSGSGRALLCTVLLSVPRLGGQSPPRRTHGKTEKWRNAFLLLSATPLGTQNIPMSEAKLWI